ncbi:hypothetical protein T492DRAFT_315503 [Pavlovales sp. CCMP2436]|nr:hypothetical protein T492DRAFT_315503 [Pavlovales sp. CCMP2436]
MLIGIHNSNASCRKGLDSSSSRAVIAILITVHVNTILLLLFFLLQETGLQLFTCTVGRKPSTAQFYLPDHERVVELLMSMRLQSAGRAKYFSVAGDLKNLSSMGEQVGGGGGSIGGRASNSSLAGMGSLGEGRSSMHDNSTKGVGGRLGSN